MSLSAASCSTYRPRGCTACAPSACYTQRIALPGNDCNYYSLRPPRLHRQTRARARLHRLRAHVCVVRIVPREHCVYFADFHPSSASPGSFVRRTESTAPPQHVHHHRRSNCPQERLLHDAQDPLRRALVHSGVGIPPSAPEKRPRVRLRARFAFPRCTLAALPATPPPNSPHRASDANLTLPLSEIPSSPPQPPRSGLFNKRFNAGLRAARCARSRYAAAKTLIRWAALLDARTI
jgi:hypothetical protein